MKLTKRFYKKWSHEPFKLREISFDEIEDIALDKGTSALKQFKKIRRLRRKEQICEEKIDEIKHDTSKAIAAFVTFEFPSERDKALFAFHSSPLSHCCFPLCKNCLKKDKNYLEGAYLKTKKPTGPSNIVWSNMDATTS